MIMKKTVSVLLVLTMVLTFAIPAMAAENPEEDYNYYVYLDSDKDEYITGDTVYVDVMIKGDLNYTQLSAQIDYDPKLLHYDGYCDLKGLVAMVSPLVPGKISVRSIPSLNTIFGEPCAPPVKIVTLKFTLTDSFTEDISATTISFDSAIVNPPAGVIGATTAPPSGLEIKPPQKTSEYNYTVYMKSAQNAFLVDDIVYVDVMIKGNIFYTQLAVDIAYDTNLLEFTGYENLQGWVASVNSYEPNIVSVNSTPTMELIYGSPCSPEVRIVTLKFTVKNSFSGNSVDTEIVFDNITVNPPAGFIGATTAPGQPLNLNLYK